MALVCRSRVASDLKSSGAGGRLRAPGRNRVAFGTTCGAGAGAAATLAARRPGWRLGRRHRGAAQRSEVPATPQLAGRRRRHRSRRSAWRRTGGQFDRRRAARRRGGVTAGGSATTIDAQARRSGQALGLRVPHAAQPAARRTSSATTMRTARRLALHGRSSALRLGSDGSEHAPKNSAPRFAGEPGALKIQAMSQTRISPVPVL